MSMPMSFSQWNHEQVLVVRRDLIVLHNLAVRGLHGLGPSHGEDADVGEEALRNTRKLVTMPEGMKAK